jgi:hypothetical protein
MRISGGVGCIDNPFLTLTQISQAHTKTLPPSSCFEMQGWMVLDLRDTTKTPKRERDIYIYICTSWTEIMAAGAGSCDCDSDCVNVCAGNVTACRRCCCCK